MKQRTKSDQYVHLTKKKETGMMSKIRITRTGELDLEFKGELIGCGTTPSDLVGVDMGKISVTVYKIQGDRFVVAVETGSS
jgi:hypothetical protein